MAPDTEFALDFCAGIGPLQLGVVLFSFKLLMVYSYDIRSGQTAVACVSPITSTVSDVQQWKLRFHTEITVIQHVIS